MTWHGSVCLTSASLTGRWEYTIDVSVLCVCYFKFEDLKWALPATATVTLFSHAINFVHRQWVTCRKHISDDGGRKVCHGWEILNFTVRSEIEPIVLYRWVCAVFMFLGQRTAGRWLGSTPVFVTDCLVLWGCVVQTWIYTECVSPYALHTIKILKPE